MRKHLANGAREFSQNHVGYTGRVLKELATDYLDMGVAAIGTVLMTNSDINVFGDYDFRNGGLISAVSIIAGFYLSKDGYGTRGFRNGYAAATGAALGSMQHPWIEIGVLTTAATVFLDKMRRKKEKITWLCKPF